MEANAVEEQQQHQRNSNISNISATAAAATSAQQQQQQHTLASSKRRQNGPMRIGAGADDEEPEANSSKPKVRTFLNKLLENLLETYD